jgi:hypothetical protein
MRLLAISWSALSLAYLPPVLWRPALPRHQWPVVAIVGYTAEGYVEISRATAYSFASLTHQTRCDTM